VGQRCLWRKNSQYCATESNRYPSSLSNMSLHLYFYKGQHCTDVKACLTTYESWNMSRRKNVTPFWWYKSEYEIVRAEEERARFPRIFLLLLVSQ
jgi:hypothetical protein